MAVSNQVTNATKNRQNGETKGNGISDTPSAPPFLEMDWHKDLWTALQIPFRPIVVLVGEPGTGKSTICQVAGYRATGGITPELVPGAPEIERADVLGRVEEDAGGHHVRWVDGPLPAALKNKSYLIVEDISAINADVRAIFFQCRGGCRDFKNPLNNETIAIPSGFKILATANPDGFVACKKSPWSRILFDGAVVLDVPGFSDDDARRLLRFHFPPQATTNQANFELALKTWSAMREIKNQGSSSPRAHLGFRSLMDLLALLELGMSLRRATEIALRNKFLVAGERELFDVADLKTHVDFDSAA